jgi:hypothetical protein
VKKSSNSTILWLRYNYGNCKSSFYKTILYNKYFSVWRYHHHHHYQYQRHSLFPLHLTNMLFSELAIKGFSWFEDCQRMRGNSFFDLQEHAEFGHFGVSYVSQFLTFCCCETTSCSCVVAAFRLMPSLCTGNHPGFKNFLYMLTTLLALH